MNHLTNESINQEFNAWLRILHFPGVLTKTVFYAKQCGSRHHFFPKKTTGTIHKKLRWNFPRFQWHLWALLKFRSGRGDGRFDGWADGGLPATKGEVSSAIAPFLLRQLMTVDGSRTPAVDTILTSTSGEISKWLAGFVPHNCRVLVPSSCILDSVFYVLVYYGR